MFIDVDTAITVPVNIVPLADDTDYKTEENPAYNAAGMDLIWNFVTTAGVQTQTAVTPTTAGVYDWTCSNGMAKCEIPASGGGSANNDTEGFGWWSGRCTGVLPWAGPVVCLRAAGTNDKLIDSAYSATRGLGGTALPDAVADAAGGLPISDTGGLDLDTKLANTNEITVARMGVLTDWLDGERLDLILDIIATDTTTDIPAKLLKYTQLLARSDSAIATDNATELTAINADGGSGAGDYANTTESQEALGDSIIITAPAAFFPVAASTVVAGTEGGTYADAISDNATYWSATDAGVAIQVIIQSEIGDGRLPTSVVINGYFDSGASRVVEGFKYDYTLDDWVKVSAGTADTEMQNRISDFSYVFPLGFNDHDHTAANHGEVKFKLLADTQNNGDVLYIDQVIFNAQPEGGLTTDTIAAAVANYDVLNVVRNGGIPFGHASKAMIDLATDVVSTDSQISFTLTGGITENDIYNGQSLSIRDVSSSSRVRVTRRIIDYTSGRVVTLNRALGFDPAVGDDVHILAATGDVNTTHLSGTSQTARDVGASVLLSSGSGTGQLDFTSGVVKSNLAQILGTALTETAGYIAAGFKKLFNVATPVMTVENVNQSANNDTKISTLITQVGTAGAGLTDLGGMSTGMKAEVNAETDTALTDYGANTTVPDAAGTVASLHTTTDGKVDAIQVDLNNATDGLGALKTLIDTVNTDLSNGTDGLGALKTLIDALPAISDINAQVVDVLKTDTISEMAQGAPPATPTFEEALNYIYRLFRNKIETTATETALYDNAGTTKLVKSTISDDATTFTKSKYVSGV